jgi:hypothetical protein
MSSDHPQILRPALQRTFEEYGRGDKPSKPYNDEQLTRIKGLWGPLKGGKEPV